MAKRDQALERALYAAFAIAFALGFLLLGAVVKTLLVAGKWLIGGGA